jgi:hypothetical protein
MRKIFLIFTMLAFLVTHTGWCRAGSAPQASKNNGPASTEKPSLKEPKLKKKPALDVKKTALLVAGCAVAVVGGIAIASKSGGEKAAGLPGPPDWPQR